MKFFVVGVGDGVLNLLFHSSLSFLFPLRLLFSQYFIAFIPLEPSLRSYSYSQSFVFYSLVVVVGVVVVFFTSSCCFLLLVYVVSSSPIQKQ